MNTQTSTSTVALAQIGNCILFNRDNSKYYGLGLRCTNCESADLLNVVDTVERLLDNAIRLAFGTLPSGEYAGALPSVMGTQLKLSIERLGTAAVDANVSEATYGDVLLQVEQVKAHSLSLAKLHLLGIARQRCLPMLHLLSSGQFERFEETWQRGSYYGEGTLDLFLEAIHAGLILIATCRKDFERNRASVIADLLERHPSTPCSWDHFALYSECRRGYDCRLNYQSDAKRVENSAYTWGDVLEYLAYLLDDAPVKNWAF